MSIHICIYTGTFLGIFNFDLVFYYCGCFLSFVLFCLVSINYSFLAISLRIFVVISRRLLGEFVCGLSFINFHLLLCQLLNTQFHLRLL